MRTRLGAPVLIAVLTLLGASACSVSIGGSSMDADKVEKSGRSFLKGKLGDEKFDKVSCPDDEDAKEGHTFECTFEGDQGTKGKLHVEVTSDDGDATLTVGSVNYTADYVQDWIGGDFASQYPDQADQLASVECPDDIPGEKGDSFTCTLTDTSGQSGDLGVTVGDDLDLEWDFSTVTPSS